MQPAQEAVFHLAQEAVFHPAQEAVFHPAQEAVFQPAQEAVFTACAGGSITACAGGSIIACARGSITAGPGASTGSRGISCWLENSVEDGIYFSQNRVLTMYHYVHPNIITVIIYIL